MIVTIKNIQNSTLKTYYFLGTLLITWYMAKIRVSVRHLSKQVQNKHTRFKSIDQNRCTFVIYVCTKQSP